MSKILLCVNFLALSIVCVCGQFEVPDATLEVLRPKGFRVSIPDVEGIKLFAFHGKLNEEMNGREGGYYSRDIVKAKNGRWTFYDPLTVLKAGDTLYYWTYVDYFDGRNKLGYPKDDQVFQITENDIPKVSNIGTSARPPPIITKPSTPTPTPTTSTEGADDCEISITKYNGGKKTCKGQLIFSDTFRSLNKNVWTLERRFAGEPDYEFVMYMSNRAEILNVANRRLTIKPVLSNEIFASGFVTSSLEYNFGSSCTGKPGTTECAQKAQGFVVKPPVVSAQISTKDTFSFLYGKIEIKARLPKGDWIYPELYLNAKREDYGNFYQSGQIRIAFVPGNSELSNVVYGGCILGASNGGRSHFMKSIRRTSDWSEGFHRFAVEWTDEKITLSVNDNVYGNIYPPEGGFAALESTLNLKGSDRWRESSSEMAPFDKEMYITVGVGVGGHNFPDRTDGTKPWSNYAPTAQKDFFKSKSKWYTSWNDNSSLEVEHVRIYAI